MGTLSLGITLVGVSGAVFGFVTGTENRECKNLLVLALLIGVASLTAFYVLKGFRWNQLRQSCRHEKGVRAERKRR